MSALLGVLGGAVAAFFVVTQAAVLIGWDVMAASFLLGVWVTVWPFDAAATRRRATRLDPSKGLADGLVLGAEGGDPRQPWRWPWCERADAAGSH